MNGRNLIPVLFMDAAGGRAVGSFLDWARDSALRKLEKRGEHVGFRVS
jgi:hypothetical protein